MEEIVVFRGTFLTFVEIIPSGFPKEIVFTKQAIDLTPSPRVGTAF